MKRNLYLCRTPLHVLYVNMIASMEISKEDTFIYYLSPESNSFQEQSIKEIKEKYGENNCFVDSLYQENNKFLNFFKIRRVISNALKVFRNESFDNVYLASIDSLPFQVLLSHLKFKALYTFDDGSANINKSSSYYVKRNTHPMMRLLSIINNNKYSKNDIVKLSKMHYTMYKNDNIIENKLFLGDFLTKLKDFNSSLDKSKNSYVCVLLGTAYNDFKENKERVINALTHRESDFDLYYPHPRCKLNLFQNKMILDSRISELKLIELLCDFKKVHVISFPSSVVLHLIDLNIFTFEILYTKDMNIDLGSFEKENVTFTLI